VVDRGELSKMVDRRWPRARKIEPSIPGRPSGRPLRDSTPCCVELAAANPKVTRPSRRVTRASAQASASVITTTTCAIFLAHFASAFNAATRFRPPRPAFPSRHRRITQKGLKSEASKRRGVTEVDIVLVGGRSISPPTQPKTRYSAWRRNALGGSKQRSAQPRDLARRLAPIES
jgi:hypothetical protein